MLDAPAIAPDLIAARLLDAFGVRAARVSFLPLGADAATAVFRVEAEGGALFLKLRRGQPDELAVRVPHLLAAQGVAHVIAPIPTRSGDLWAPLAEYSATLAPFIAGVDGYAQALSGPQWAALGATLRGLHDAQLPPDLLARLPRERYSPSFRARARELLDMAAREQYRERHAAGMAELLRARRDQILRMVDRAEQLGDALRGQAGELAVCHADIHPGNVLLTPDGELWVVDWDTLTLAPRERDLMFVGSSQMWSGPEAAARFAEGYGAYAARQEIIAYYRYERIVQDIVAYAEQLLLSDDGEEDRAFGLRAMSGQFAPGHEVALAFAGDPG